MNTKFLKFLAFFAFLILVNMSALACKGTDVIFQDNFSKLDPSWGVANDQQKVTNNSLTIIPNVNMTHLSLNQSNIFQDMDFCADIKLIDGDDSNAGGGLIFWAKDYDDYYYFYILGDGSAYVGRYVNGRFLYPVPSKKDASINTAKGAINHLEVITKGNQATVYINDKEFASFTGQTPEGGGLIGLSGDSPAKSKNTWGFSNVKITKPL